MVENQLSTILYGKSKKMIEGLLLKGSEQGIDKADTDICNSPYELIINAKSNF